MQYCNELLLKVTFPNTARYVHVLYVKLGLGDMRKNWLGYLEESLQPGCFGAPLTSIVGKIIIWKSMVPQNCSVSHFLQNIVLCVQQNKDIHTGLELLEGE